MSVDPTTNGHPAGLPAPTSPRWQPLRLGLLNLYRFDDEQFRFAGGRLLLRGNNGTGKSRVLALTLPFLFDGEVAAHRLEPDGDTAKRVEWNLLLGRHDDRLGYTWIEFGRLDDDGTPHFCTLGIGMRAVKGRGLAGKWYFTTALRVVNRRGGGVSDDGTVSLVADAGQALTRDRLRSALDTGGEVFDTAHAYRAEVDRRLFGLGQHRYDALVDLLIQLRRPQLSRQMDEQALSDALSEALPPLPRAVVADVAEAFRTLETDRDQLAAFSAAAEATATFLDTYGRYAATAVRRRALEVTATHGDYERTQRRLRETERDRTEADERLATLTEQRDAAREDERRHAEQARTLEASPAMDRVRELEHARRDATDTAARAAEVEADRDRAADRVAEHERRVAASADRLTRSRDEVGQSVDRAVATTESAVLPAAHGRALATLAATDVRDGATIDDARRAAEQVVTRRRDAIAHLRTLAGRVADARTSLDTVKHRRDDLAAQLDAARDGQRDATAARETAVADVLADYRDWAQDLQELTVPAPDELSWELETWEAGADQSPLARAVEQATSMATRRLAHARASATRDRDDVRARRDETAEERARVAAARHLPPPVPHTRDPEARIGRPGAPLWQLVEPVTDLTPDRTAGYEAALEAAGLLDAWVSPDGQVTNADTHDLLVAAADLPEAPDGGLAAVLVPAVDAEDPQASAVDPDVVRTVLGRIGRRAGDGTVWVADDGRHRVGPLHGRWTKPAAAHLGHAARQAARRDRLAELDRELADLDAHLARLDTDLDELDRRAERVADEQATAPTDTSIREAAAAHLAAVRQVAALRERVAEADAAVATAAAELDQARTTHDDAATDLGLTDHTDDLDTLAAALADHVAALAALWPTLHAHAGRLADHDRAATDLDGASADLERHRDRARQARDDATAAATRRDTLEDTVGEEAGQLLTRLEQARTDRKEAAARRERLDEDRAEATGDQKAAQQRIDDLTETLDDHAGRRADAVARLAAVDDAGLLPVADPSLAGAAAGGSAGEWSPDRGVRVARKVDRALAAVSADDASWDRVQRGIHGHFADLEHALLPHDLHPTASLVDDLFVVTAPFQGADRSMPALHGLLVDEVTNRQALLTAREREVLQNHLIGDVAAHLHRLLREGEDWVAEVNAELDRMPTATGMKLRFAWQPRADLPTFAPARRHLLAHHAGWTPEQRDEIGAFLQERIAQVRETDPTGTWQAHLDAALDHRAWHHFVVERHQDGQWVRLTRRSHGTGSGGEKALALTVPQFAAAAAHYRSADPHAPRLIMLDEAFVGIDASMRAKCLGLLEQFDLDLVMTSEREWGCYPTVPALAITQLATRPGVDAVGVSRWVWNGRERVRADA